MHGLIELLKSTRRKLSCFSFNHVSFGILIESLKLVFFFTEGLKFVNASTQIKCYIGALAFSYCQFKSMCAYNLCSKFGLVYEFVFANNFYKFTVTNFFQKFNITNSFFELICEFGNLRKSSYEFARLRFGSFLRNQCYVANGLYCMIYHFC